MANKRLDNAKRNKADEFYTQLVDIELEMKHIVTSLKVKPFFVIVMTPTRATSSNISQ